MTCKYSLSTGRPWFIQRPDGAQTIRCYLPNAIERGVGGGLTRYATVGDTFDLTRPALPQILREVPYVSVRDCKCGRDCFYYEERGGESE